MKAGRRRRDHIWTGIRSAKEARKGGDTRKGFEGGSVLLAVRGLFFPYLKESWRHRPPWHAIIGRHVTHHWTGGSGRTLWKAKEFFLLVFVNFVAWKNSNQHSTKAVACDIQTIVKQVHRMLIRTTSSMWPPQSFHYSHVAKWNSGFQIH